ncbi:MAG: helix-turn-helix domain-containing protein, partial [Halodesulfurarchaeum sp.]
DRVSVEDFETTIRECLRTIRSVPEESSTILSLGGGARDVLLPLTVAALVLTDRIDQTLFFSDLDLDVRAVSLPDLTAQVPARTEPTFERIVATDGWLTLTELADATDQSKSTVIRHVQDLEDAGVLEADTSGKAKRVEATLSGDLIRAAWTGQD